MELGPCDVALEFDQAQNHVGMAPYTSRQTVAAKRPGAHIALGRHPQAPADRAGRAKPEPGRSLTARYPALNRGDHTIPQVH